MWKIVFSMTGLRGKCALIWSATMTLNSFLTAFQVYPVSFVGDLYFLFVDVWTWNEMIPGVCWFEVEPALPIIVVYSLELIWSGVYLLSTVRSETFVSDIVSVTHFIPQLLAEFEQHWTETKSI